MKPMPTNAIAEGVTEFGSRMTESADALRAKAEVAQREVARRVQRAKIKAEDLLQEGRYEIKERPLAAISAFMVAGLAIGFAAGMLVGRKRWS